MAIENPLWMDPNPSTGVAPEYSARQDRGIIARLFTEGVEDVQGGNLLVAQRAAGANMTVEVAAGAAYVAGDDVARQGTYRVVVTSTETVTIGAAPASNSRIDLVVLRVRDATALGGSQHGASVEVITGTVAASPVAPAVPNTAIALAQVLVPSGATSIVTANITDRRLQSGANAIKVATSMQPMTAAQRDALSGPELFDGRVIDNITTARSQIRRAGAWVDIAPTAAQKAQGFYNGDGVGGRIIVVGFKPDLVLLSGYSSSGSLVAAVHSTDAALLQSSGISGATPYLTNDVHLVDAGFKLPQGGNISFSNNNSRSYAWTAFKFL